MEQKEVKYAKGRHPNSLASLKKSPHSGRPRQFDGQKKSRSLSMTDEGWQGMKEAAKQYGYKSLSEFLEKWGRGEIKVSA